MNAAWLGDWNLGPKAHPNDGLLDVTEGRVRAGELLQARSRARTGTHVPHPDIRETRAAAMQFEMRRPTPVYLDGEYVATARFLSIRTEPDALTCVV